MKKDRWILLLSFCIMNSFLLHSQSNTANDKKAAQIKKCEDALHSAETKLAISEKQLAAADSMVNVSSQSIREAKTELKTIEVDRKKLDKDFSANRKPLEKQAQSKEKDDAVQGKADLKALEMQYKADSKAMDTRFKEATKKLTSGETGLAKGKENQKKAKEACKTNGFAVEVAQLNLDEASGSGEKKKEKNKK